jgi:hypothetical protein
MVADLKSLKARRGNIKGRLTRFSNFFKDQENTNKFSEIKRRLQSVTSCLTEFEEVHSQIQELDATQATEVELIDFENEYYKVISEADTIINDHQAAFHSSQVKLPDIQLPLFSGLFTEWVTFKDTFLNLIHNNNSLSGVQKFHYLQSSLTGEARQNIEHLTISNENYATAWQILSNRYENNRLIIHHHIRAIFNLSAISKDPKSLRQLLQTATMHLKVLNSLNRPTNHWDDLLVHIITSKFDQITILAWESSLTNEIPTYQQLEDFMTQRCQTLESLQVTSLDLNAQKSDSKSKHFSNPPTKTIVATTCCFCKKSHNLYHCKDFLSLTIPQRISEIRKLKLCTNCLRESHKVESCTSSTCRKCSRKHNTLLHIETNDSDRNQISPSVSSTSSHCSYLKAQDVILSTALVKVFDCNGKPLQLRALLDSGSQSSFITESIADKLKLSFTHINVPVTGINESISTAKKLVELKIHSNITTFSATLTCLVSKKITERLPIVSINLSNFTVPPNIKLADPKFNVSSEIDLLIGSDLFWSLLSVGQIAANRKGPIFQKTQLGWIVGGHNYSWKNPTAVCTFSQVENDIQKFWQIEQFDTGSGVIKSADNICCEQQYRESVCRQPNGRFMVKLPLTQKRPVLGESRQAAIKRLKAVEHKFSKDPKLKADYTAFMNEYLKLSHMQIINDRLEPDNCYYLPHHPVYKRNDNQSAIRVVFDGSAKSTNGLSLNDNLLTGEMLQEELFAILTRFRTHQYVLTADIAKMYRMIDIHPEHRDYQRIVWKFSPEEPIKTYQLNTVTYGMTSSPFLAIRTLQELARSEAKNFPNSYKMILRDFYVDDLLTGSSTVEELHKIRDDVTEILRRGGFELRKFRTNEPQRNKSEKQELLSLAPQTNKKTLGLLWDNQHDVITFAYNDMSISRKITKRTVLSTISHLFDPIGLITPVTVTAKIILQRIWSLKLDWDESLPLDLHTTWVAFLRDFQFINQVQIPRKIISDRYPVNMQIHGFSDASQLSYGACVYLRCTMVDGTHSSNLICSKNRVAPLRPTTIPRLELCAAVLLIQLISKLKITLNLPISKYSYWTDSQIVIAWIKTEPHKLKTFIANRISKIQESSDMSDWSYTGTFF